MKVRLADGSVVTVPERGGATRPRACSGPVELVSAQRTHSPTVLDGGSPHSRALGLAPAGTRVLLLGCGSVGSHVGLTLARMGCDLVAVDKQTVDLTNIEAGRTAYGPQTLGMPKVLAMAHTAKEMGLAREVIPLRRGVEALSDVELRSLACDSSVVVAAIDDRQELFRLNALLYGERPAVYPGFHSGALSGHVIWTRPGAVPCFRCAMGLRSSEGLETLHGEPGNPLDIQRISEMTARVALWLCSTPGSESGELLDPNQNILFVDNRPSGSAERALAVHLLPADRDPNCPVCGSFNRQERR